MQAAHEQAAQRAGRPPFKAPAQRAAGAERGDRRRKEEKGGPHSRSTACSKAEFGGESGSYQAWGSMQDNCQRAKSQRRSAHVPESGAQLAGATREILASGPKANAGMHMRGANPIKPSKSMTASR
eukprot:624976-Pyramimonas_sp.AAC.1